MTPRCTSGCTGTSTSTPCSAPCPSPRPGWSRSPVVSSCSCTCPTSREPPRAVTRAEGSSETDDGTDGPPTNRRSNNHSRRVGCRRTHSGHGDAVRLLPGGDPSGLLRLLVPSQAAAVRVVPALPPADDGGGADVAPLECSRVRWARDLGPVALPDADGHALPVRPSAGAA